MQFGWIDFSKQDKNNAINVINSLAEKGVLDELGFASIRSAFSDTFFPGTSTIQTRAKYFLLIPYILNDYINKGHKIEKDFNGFYKYSQKKINEKEKDVGLQLIANCKADPLSAGIIGSRSLASKDWVERTPLSIYWNGLRTYKFFRSDNPYFSYSDFLSQVYNLEKNKAASENSENTDKEDKNDSDAGNYLKKSPLVKLPAYKKNWDKSVDIELTAEEAAFLKEKIISSVKDSIFAIILSKDIDISKCSDFETFTEVIKTEVDEEKKAQLDLANKFNDFYYIIMLRYNYKLSKGLDENIVSEWNKYFSKVKEICTKLDIDDLFIKMKILNPKLKIFMIELKKAFIENDIDKADEIIKKREFNLKTNRAKLSMEDYSADKYPIFNRFDYRFSNAKRLISDIRLEREK